MSACSRRNTTPRAGRQVGNFPQAFSHLALVNTAMNLTRASKPADERAERAPSALGEPNAHPVAIAVAALVVDEDDLI